jgi:RNA polymerase sigma-70 factor (ECF subfamily)
MADADAELVARAVAGEAGAFDELVRRYRPRLVRSIALLIGDADEAESLAQEALTRAYAQLASFRTELPFGPWLHGIALNLCRAYLRDRSRHARPVAPERLGEEASAEGRRQGVLSGILRREAGDHTQRAISQLPESLREAFVLHFIEGLEYAAMSRITGVAAGTLRVRAHRARTLLRGSLGAVVDTWLREAGPGSGQDKESS